MEKKEASQLLSTLSNSENARFIAMSLMESRDPSMWMVFVLECSCNNEYEDFRIEHASGYNEERMESVS